MRDNIFILNFPFTLIASLHNSRSPAKSYGSELIHGLGIRETWQVFSKWAQTILFDININGSNRGSSS